LNDTYNFPLAEITLIARRETIIST